MSPMGGGGRVESRGSDPTQPGPIQKPGLRLEAFGTREAGRRSVSMELITILSPEKDKYLHLVPMMFALGHQI